MLTFNTAFWTLLALAALLLARMLMRVMPPLSIDTYASDDVDRQVLFYMDGDYIYADFLADEDVIHEGWFAPFDTAIVANTVTDWVMHGRLPPNAVDTVEIGDA